MGSPPGEDGILEETEDRASLIKEMKQDAQRGVVDRLFSNRKARVGDRVSLERPILACP